MVLGGNVPDKHIEHVLLEKQTVSSSSEVNDTTTNDNGGQVEAPAINSNNNLDPSITTTSIGTSAAEAVKSKTKAA